MPQDYNATLNLPQTEFPMRGNLPKREPEILARWEQTQMYQKLMQKNKGKKRYVLHDGPPYANGNIHMGTAMNKVLKDIIVRYKNMAGFCAPFVPGWDTHGLPIELKALKKDGVDPASISQIELRKLCSEFANSFIDAMTKQFQRLGVIGDFDAPYKTLHPSFEAKQVEIFGEMAKKNFIYKGRKPVHWCAACHTALAEAEIEYENDACDSIFVKFTLKEDHGKFAALGIDKSKVSFVIWTTTTWTLPGNVAICLGPNYEYVVVQTECDYLVVAKELLEKTMQIAGMTDYQVVGTFFGKELEYMRAAHPFLDRTSLVICGEHVTLESGTGCVHTAPGHGVEDFEVCKHYPELPMVMPVDDKGHLTDEAGSFAGMFVQKANKKIAEHLQQTGRMFALQHIEHQYPHCWRCKQPVLFRATQQWFCSVNDFKEDALRAIGAVKWIPSWGQNRIEAMVRDRSDWCISRQRTWGVPIPILYCNDCNEPLINDQTIEAIAKLFAKEGGDAWYLREPEEFLPASVQCPCGGTKFTKESDIMDVWFDSGVSHAAVLEGREDLSWPADLYLEGADQYRGWFQSSLLTAVAYRQKAPYKTVTTHGWVVDGAGKKMSKSLGNGIEASEIIDQYGADILRLWVASSDYHADVRISKEILTGAGDAYRKLRNTAKYMLGNLFDFDPDSDSVPLTMLPELDQLILHKCNALIIKVLTSYENFAFYQAYHALHSFCVIDLSNFYLDITKDRLYCEQTNGVDRRAGQTTMYLLLETLTKLLAPILAFTADEIWQFMPHRADHDLTGVVFCEMPTPLDLDVTEDFTSKWELFLTLHRDVQKAMEEKRTAKIIGKSLDAAVRLHGSESLLSSLRGEEQLLKTIFICSEVVLANGAGEYVGEVEGLSISITKAQGDKCERCWCYSPSIGEDMTHPSLCARCVGVLKGGAMQ